MPTGTVVPSDEELHRRRLVGINEETVTDVTGRDIPFHYPGEDHSWNLEKFRNSLKVQFHQNEPYHATFSLVGVDASIANAFRRILLAEIPTLAIEDCFVYNNTSIIQDEVLCHRLGLIPLTGSRQGLQWMSRYMKPPPDNDPAAKAAAAQSGDYDNPAASTPSDNNTVVMHLHVECKWRENGKALAKQGEIDPKKLYENSSVYAHQMLFEPQGQQAQFFASPNEIRPVNPEILIAKLRPGQKINIRCHCIKGIGGDHAKFSPVATATYRLLPHIDIRQPITGADAHKFAKCFPKGVIEEVTDPETGVKKAVVADPMKDTVSRECLRHDEFKDKVKLGRYRDHFIFSVESTGQAPSDELFIDSLRLLKEKCSRFKRDLAELMR